MDRLRFPVAGCDSLNLVPGKLRAGCVNRRSDLLRQRYPYPTLFPTCQKRRF